MGKRPLPNGQIVRCLALTDSPGRDVLIIEDHADLAETVAEVVGLRGREARIATTGSQGLRMAKESPPALVILDLALPDIDGMSVCQELLALPGTRVIVVTARDDADTAAAALRMGADDYVRKPFSLTELMERLEAVLRRGAEQSGEVLRVGPLTLDLVRCIVEVEGRVVQLRATELRLLTFLAQHPGWVFSKERLLASLWPDDRDVHAVQVQISSLRHKIEKDPENPRLLVTVKGLGYKLEPGEGA